MPLTIINKIIYKNKQKLGFTLLELLVVISIIGLLIAMGTASYSTAQKKARNARRKGDMQAIQAAFEQFYSANNSAYPTSCSSGSSITIMTGVTFTIPTDPKTPTYTYTNSDCDSAGYCICADMEGEYGNSNSSCSWSSSGDHFCVQNRQ